MIFAVALALYVVPSNEYIFLPDRAHPVAPLVTVPGGHDPAKGGDLLRRRDRPQGDDPREALRRPAQRRDLYPATAVNPPGVNDTQRQRIDLEDMTHSQQVAAAVALQRGRQEGGRCVRPARSSTEVVGGLPADGKLEPDDVIVGDRRQAGAQPRRTSSPRCRGARSARRSRSRSTRDSRRSSSGCAPSPRARSRPARGRRHPGRDRGRHPPADPRQHRRGQRRRAVGRPRVRARGAAEAGPRRRPRPQDRRDRRDLPGRLGRPDRRNQAERRSARAKRVWTPSSCPLGRTPAMRARRRMGFGSSL